MFQDLEEWQRNGEEIGADENFPRFLRPVSIDSLFRRWIMDAFASGRLDRVEITDHARAETDDHDLMVGSNCAGTEVGTLLDKVMRSAADSRPLHGVTNKHKYAVGNCGTNLSHGIRTWKTNWNAAQRANCLPCVVQTSVMAVTRAAEPSRRPQPTIEDETSCSA